MKIDEKLKNLRKMRDITQEEFASYLNVSPQAVSRWERGEAYPDITLLPGIANFYGVSTDELLCMDTLRSEKQREEFFQEHNRLFQSGNLEGAIAMLREVRLEHPNDFEILLALANDLAMTSMLNSKESIKESIDILELVHASGNEEERRSAELLLTDGYLRLGQRDKALELANKNYIGPFDLLNSFQLVKLLEGEPKIMLAQRVFMTLAAEFDQFVKLIASEPCWTYAEKIEMYGKTIEIFRLVFGNEDCYYSGFVAQTYLNMALAAVEVSELENAVEHIKNCVLYSERQNENIEHYQYRSVFVNRFSFSSDDIIHIGPKPSLVVLNELAKPQFDAVRSDVRFAAAIERLESISK